MTAHDDTTARRRWRTLTTLDRLPAGPPLGFDLCDDGPGGSGEVYPVLLLVGAKLLLEDFPHGQPVTLFVALILVGGALLLVAKLLSRDK